VEVVVVEMVSGWASDKFIPDDDWLIWGKPAGLPLPLATG